MSRTYIARFAAALALGLGAAATLPAQQTGSRDSSTAGPTSHGMMHSMDSTKHGGTMTMPMGAASHGGMAGMTGMMGMGGAMPTMAGMTSHMTQMLGVMQEHMTTIQRLVNDSSVARDPKTMQALRQMQDHMAAMMAVMQPMIARMQQRAAHSDSSRRRPHPDTHE